ncbi:MAG: hypothetical protein K9M54_11610 [Kiritimatiellales bacterium]|nr:hypothetical protein [Kiritimatiellales bacterium]MCF7863732.1 hypothetical protein [Kiritimatiellales bacterium]
MIKTYISTLLVVILVGAHWVQAQESLDDVFAQLDAASGTSSDTVAAQPAAAAPAPAVTDAAPATEAPAVADAAPAMADTAVVAPAAVETSGAAVVVAETPMAAETDELTALFNKGVGYYREGDYDHANAVFEAMLAIDQYDSRAIAYQKRTAQRISAVEVRKQEASRASAIAQIDSAWNPEAKSNVAINSGDTEKKVDPDTLAKQQMEARLRGIMIPSLDFRDANIKDVVLFLTETCRRLDPQGKGVNILLLGMDSGDTPGAAGNNITISIRDMSLYESLQYIVEMASLKFEVKPAVVAISPVNYVAEVDMILKSYDVIPEVGADLESLSGAKTGGGADDLFGDASAKNDAGTGPVNVAQFFSIVEFPEGSSAIYQSRFHKLFVKNTPKNIKMVEDILADLEDEAIKKRSQQVEIEAKFVEFNEGALQELGFDWTVYGQGSVAGLSMDGTHTRSASGVDAASVTTTADGRQIYTDPVTGQEVIQNGGQSVFGDSQRSNTGAFESLTSGLLSQMGGTPATMLFSNGDIDLQISALEQQGTADVLSAPKVTTKSGNEAVIRVVETHRYPQDYDVETGQRTAPVVKPQDWEDFDLGVVLKVTPVVDADSNTIDLDLAPEIKKFKGYDTYVVGYNAYETGQNVAEIKGSGEPLLAKMPYFELRTVQTQVTIADGHTVLMGGLVDERTETFRDQVPFLGDIPYIGRLFRTEGSRTSKKNLVIYVKATQVDDRGMTRADRELARQTVAK